jgi:hypothetical protein
MEIIRENTVTTSLLAYEGEVYIRTESNLNIRWNKEMKPTLYEYFKSIGKWYELSVNGDFKCDLPELECKYQELKPCN